MRACAAQEPGALILIGDCELRVPLRSVLAPVLAVGWRVHWIIGNRDVDTEATYDNLAGDFAEGDIGGKVIELGGLRIGGLGGVFKPRVWYPRADAPEDAIEPARFETRAAFVASLPARERWRGGLPLWHRDTIFPEDFAALAQHRFDVLISHEAPSVHRHGSGAIDRLAEACGVKLIVHGHHHESYTATLPSGVAVRGLGVAEAWGLEVA